MLDIGWPELLVVAIVLIVVVGPKDLPPMLRAFGRTTKKLRGMASEFRGQFDEALREAELDDVKQTFSDAKKLNPMQSIRDAVNPLKDTARDIRSDLEKSVNSKPSSSTPAKVDVPEPTMKLDNSPPKVDTPKPASKTPDGEKPAKTQAAASKAQGSEAKSGSTAKGGAGSKSAAARSQSAKSGSAKTPASGTAASKPAAKKPAASGSTGSAASKSSGARTAGAKPAAKPAAGKTAGAAKTGATKAGGEKPATGKTGAKSPARARKPKQNEGSA